MTSILSLASLRIASWWRRSVSLFLPRPAYVCFEILPALYFYEKILVYYQEIDLIWRRRKIGLVIPVVYGTMHISTTLYLLMYLCAPSYIPCEVRRFFNFTHTKEKLYSCFRFGETVLAIGIVYNITLILTYLSWSGASQSTVKGCVRSTARVHDATVISTLRVYAINGRRPLLPLLVLLSSLVPVAANIVSVMQALYSICSNAQWSSSTTEQH